MRYSQLSPNLSISKLILGTWQFAANHSNASTKEVNHNDILHAYLQNNITTITSANIYQESEVKVGHFLNKYRNDFNNDSLPSPQILTLFTALPDQLKKFTRKDLLASVDSALQRLQVDQIDMMQYFCWDLDDSYYIQIGKWLQEAQKDGKINNIGISNVNTNTLQAVLKHDIPVVSNQIQYSILDRRAEKKMQDFCKKNNVSIIAYGTMAGGLLSAKFLNKKKDDFIHNPSTQKYCRVIDLIGGWDIFQSMLDELNKLALEKEISIAQLASAYILSKDAVDAIILGAHNTNHLDSNLAILDIDLSANDVDKINMALSSLKDIEGDIYEEELNYERTYGRLKD